MSRSAFSGLGVLTVLAFSDDVVAALPEKAQRLGVEIVLDVVLIALLVASTPRDHGWRSGTSRPPLFLTWALGAGLTLALDAATWGVTPSTAAERWLMAGGSAGYYLALLVLLLPLAGTNLGHLRRVGGHGLRIALRPHYPWIGGMAAAYLGSFFWTYYLGRQPGDTVDQQFFAQASQIIPLMLIAAGAPYWSNRRSPARGAERYTLALLCIGEITALTALVRRSQSSVPLFGAWFQYLTFIVVLFALGAALVVVIDSMLHAETGPASDPIRPLDEARTRSAAATGPSTRRRTPTLPPRAAGTGLDAVLKAGLAGVVLAVMYRFARRKG